jgi:hypothetical protein
MAPATKSSIVILMTGTVDRLASIFGNRNYRAGRPRQVRVDWFRWPVEGFEAHSCWMMPQPLVQTPWSSY